jgi:hypothetical protein
MPRDFQDMLSRSLDERRSWEADVKYRLYVKPLGNRGLHVVKSSVDGEEFIVSGPGQTFRPGTVVPTASNTGTQGESIVSDPPPGRRGAGRISPTKWTHQSGGCPRCITGKSYIGIVEETSTNTLYAYSYSDGELGSLLDQVALPSSLQKIPAYRWGWQLADSTTIVWTQEITGGNETIGIWDLGGSAGPISDDYSNFIGAPMVYGGELYYLLEKPSDTSEARKVAPTIGASSSVIGDITESGREPSQQIVVVLGAPYAWISSGSPDGWYGISSNGPEVSNGGMVAGGVVALGGCIGTRFGVGPTWVQTNLSQNHLWPPAWQSLWSWELTQSHNAHVRVSLTPLEYSAYDPSSGSLVRFGTQNFSAVDTSKCSLPSISVQPSPKGRPDVMLPL